MWTGMFLTHSIYAYCTCVHHYTKIAFQSMLDQPQVRGYSYARISRFCSCDLDLDLVTLIYDLDLDVLK